MRAAYTQWTRHSGDYWGGFAAMLVALPASVAFGVTVYAAISPSYAAFGALAGVVGAACLGLIASAMGGTDRLISAPCAPAAALLTAFTLNAIAHGVANETVVLMLTIMGILAGVIQLLMGFLGVGKLIRYVPFPVVSGYMTAVGLIIIGSQLPKLLGAPHSTAWQTVLMMPNLWDWRGVSVGAVTLLAMIFGDRLTTKVPSTILAIAIGILTYGCLAIGDPTLRDIDGNELVIGPLGITGKGYGEVIAQRWQQISHLTLGEVAQLIGGALTLAVLLSIDTLKTCVVLDQITRSRHDSNRELVAQGIANLASSAIGGMPGAGTMGASMVNLSSGGKTRLSGMATGVFTVLAALLLGSFVAWIPIAALSGVLIAVGIRMIDTSSLRYLESRTTALDFAMVVVVIAVALTEDLVAASATGVVLSICLFLREQVGGAVIRRVSRVGERTSVCHRREAALQQLLDRGSRSVIYELQGSLFFGTAYKLYRALEAEFSNCECLIIDLSRVLSIDVTAAHMLGVVHQTLAERNVPLLLSGVRDRLPNGFKLREFLTLNGVIADQPNANRHEVLVLPSLDAALEWAEDRLLDQPRTDDSALPPLTLQEIDLFQGRKDDTLQDLEAILTPASWRAGEHIFRAGDVQTNLYLLRSGEVRIMARGGATGEKHLATYGRGDFFGGLAFLDHRPRSSDAIATCPTQAYVLTLDDFNQLAETHKRTALILLWNIARATAVDLRNTDRELALLEGD